MAENILYIDVDNLRAFRRAAREVGHWLRGAVLASPAPLRVDVDGWPGIGKTELLRQVTKGVLAIRHLPARLSLLRRFGRLYTEHYASGGGGVAVEAIIHDYYGASYAGGMYRARALPVPRYGKGAVLIEHPPKDSKGDLHIQVGFEKDVEEAQRKTGQEPHPPFADKRRRIVITTHHEGLLPLRPLMEKLQAAGIEAHFTA